jgi:hypothetical protein
MVLCPATPSLPRNSRASTRRICWPFESTCVPYYSFFRELALAGLASSRAAALRASCTQHSFLSGMGTGCPSSIAAGLWRNPFGHLLLNLDDGLTLAGSGDNYLSLEHHRTSSRSRHIGLTGNILSSSLTFARSFGG